MSIIGNALKVIAPLNNRLYIYRTGDTGTFTSLAWADSYSHSAHAPSISYSPTLTITQDVNHAGIAYYSTMVDLTDYSYIYAKGTYTANSTTNNGVYVEASLTGGGYYPAKASAKQEIAGNGQQTVTVDVRSLSGSYYIAFGLARSGGVNSVFTITEVYAE